MNPYSRLFSRHVGFFLLAPETGGGGGGGAGKGTLKDQLEQANEKLGVVEGEKEQLGKDLKAANEKVTKLEGDKEQLGKDLKAANEKVTKLEGDKEQLGKDLKAANEKITTLEGDAKTTEEKATEKAAANGHKPAPVDPGRIEGGKDGAALHAEYENLKGREKTAFFREHEKALMAYAKQVSKAA